MPLKIVHCADLHIGAPCLGLNTSLSAARSSEIRSSLTYIADFCKQKQADALIICGDLFDTYEPSKADCDFVRDTLSCIAPIDVFILCGNHDYMCAQSPFSKQDYFSDNVHIFPCFEHCFDLPKKNAAFWGKSYSSPTITASFFDYTPDYDKINILCLHGEMSSSSTYNIIDKEILGSFAPDYAAFGHIHNAQIFTTGKVKCAYSGIPEGHKFNDDGNTGFIYAEITKDETKLTPVSFTKRKYCNITLDITGKDSISIIEEAQKLINDTDLFRLTFTGTFYENEVFNTSVIEKELKTRAFYIEVTDETTAGYDIAAIEKEESLRGVFLQELRKLTDDEDEFNRSAKAGLDALMGRVPDSGGII